MSNLPKKLERPNYPYSFKIKERFDGSPIPVEIRFQSDRDPSDNCEMFIFTKEKCDNGGFSWKFHGEQRGNCAQTVMKAYQMVVAAYGCEYNGR